MSPPDIKLHAALIRSVRGLINAWEEWVRAHMPPPDESTDPVKHFQDIAAKNQTRR